jgi:hypothetical protein
VPGQISTDFLYRGGANREVACVIGGLDCDFTNRAACIGLSTAAALPSVIGGPGSDFTRVLYL